METGYPLKRYCDSTSKRLNVVCIKSFSHFQPFFLFRIQYRKDAQNAYQQRMLEAHAGHSDFPRVRTFRPLDSSTNNVFDDLKEAERWTGVQGKVDMSELTWEQRERILRMLFAKMNGFKEKRRYGVSHKSIVAVLSHPKVKRAVGEGAATRRLWYRWYLCNVSAMYHYLYYPTGG